MPLSRPSDHNRLVISERERILTFDLRLYLLAVIVMLAPFVFGLNLIMDGFANRSMLKGTGMVAAGVIIDVAEVGFVVLARSYRRRRSASSPGRHAAN